MGKVQSVGWSVATPGVEKYGGLGSCDNSQIPSWLAIWFLSPYRYLSGLYGSTFQYHLSSLVTSVYLIAPRQKNHTLRPVNPSRPPIFLSKTKGDNQSVVLMMVKVNSTVNVSKRYGEGALLIRWLPGSGCKYGRCTEFYPESTTLGLTYS